MNAALRLSWYKFKHHYMDFVKVLLGIVAFEGLILYIQDKGFLKDFETTRMTLFLLLFSTSLLIVVQNSIYISKERSVLNRDFFSGLSRSAFALASMGIHAFFAVLETIVFILSYSVFSKFFDKEFPDAGHIFGSYRWEVGITVILAVIVGIMQFSLSGTILSLPKAIDWVQKFIYLGYGHKLFGISSDLSDLPSSLAKYHVPVPKSQLEAFQGSTGEFWGQWWALVLHCLVYALLFFITLQKKEK